MQNTILGIIKWMSPTRVENFERILEELEQSGDINRKLDALPTQTELHRLMVERMGLTRPEISVILSHTKLLLTHKLAHDPIVQDPIFRPLLQSYFPEKLIKKYPDAIDTHPLRAELLAMLLSNRLINQISPYMPRWLKDRTGLGYVDVTRAFWVCSELYDFNRHWLEAYHIQGLPAEVWQDLLIELLQHMDRTLPWFLNQPDLLRDMTGTVEHYRPHFEKLGKNIAALLPPQRRYFRDAHEQRLLAMGAPPALAAFHADLRSHAASPGIVALSLELGQPVLDVARVYFTVGERFGFDALREQARQSMGNDYWEREAISALIEDFSSHQLRMTQLMASSKMDLIQWENSVPQLVGRMDALMNELRSQPKASVTQLTVANRRLRGLVPVSASCRV
jgi:glutamate dehydrogenase